MGTGEIIGIASLLVTLIGFAITIYNVKKARKLSSAIRNDLKRIDSISELSSALSCMEEIKTLHRAGTWQILPNKYSILRRALIIIRETNPDINNDSKKVIQSTISILSSLENEIETSNYGNITPPNVPKINQAISRQMDKLQPILVEMQNQIGR